MKRLLLSLLLIATNATFAAQTLTVTERKIMENVYLEIFNSIDTFDPKVSVTITITNRTNNSKTKLRPRRDSNITRTWHKDLAELLTNEDLLGTIETSCVETKKIDGDEYLVQMTSSVFVFKNNIIKIKIKNPVSAGFEEALNQLLSKNQA